jgi:5-methylcytosine-specific restriction endonuclease McrA
MLKKCTVCNEEFEAYRSGKLCSDKCREEKELQRSRKRARTKKYQEQQRRYREEHRVVAVKRQRTYYATHKDRLNSTRRKKYAKNPEPAKLQAKTWAQKNKQRKTATDKAWVKSNPDKFKAAQHRHRTAKKSNGGSFTAAEWTALCKHYHNRCLRCGKRRKLTADHVIPVSKGGSSNISNIQPLCGPCNSSKGIKSTDFR